MTSSEAELATERARIDTARTDTAHPSLPIPVSGPPLGAAVRTPLADTGVDVFPVALGAAEFGWHVDLAAAHEILDRFAERGGNLIHTADAYAGGRSEHIVGAWLRTRAAGRDMVTAVRIGGHPDNPGLGATSLVRAVEASLERLRIDRIDVLYLDATTDQSTPLEDTLATCEWLIESGKVRALGAAGFAPERLVEARVLAAAGYPRFSALDVHYNVMNRGAFEGDLRLVAGAQGLAVTPSHPLEHGFLTGASRTRPRTGLSARGAQLRASATRRGERMLRALEATAVAHGVPSAAISVAWLLAQRLVVAPITNAFAVSHIDELVQGVGVRLSRADLAELTRAAE